jgi:hypothetical protein
MKYVKNMPFRRPTVEGFYWTKCLAVLAGREYETIVKVFFSNCFGPVPTGSSPNTVFWDGEVVRIDDCRLLAFAGPIPSPEK